MACRSDVTSSTVGFSSKVETVVVGIEAKVAIELTSTAITVGSALNGEARLGGVKGM